MYRSKCRHCAPFDQPDGTFDLMTVPRRPVTIYLYGHHGQTVHSSS
jgi:hypothetical protein